MNTTLKYRSPANNEATLFLRVHLVSVTAYSSSILLLSAPFATACLKEAFSRLPAAAAGVESVNSSSVISLYLTKQTSGRQKLKTSDPSINGDENVTREYLREQVREAVGTPAKQNIVKRLNFCMWTEQAERWIDMAIWEEGSHVVDAAQLKDRKCLGGLADPFYVKAIRIAVVTHGLGANTPKK